MILGRIEDVINKFHIRNSLIVQIKGVDWIVFKMVNWLLRISLETEPVTLMSVNVFLLVYLNILKSRVTDVDHIMVAPFQ